MPVDAIKRTTLVAYGSETGNAQDFAEELGRLVERIHFNALVVQLDGVDISSLAEFSVIIFVVSTTGQGDLPSNASLFWKSLLRKKLSNDFLSNVNFTSFGLGDRSYPRFNWAARKLHKRLLQLGAVEIYPRGEADEQHEEGLDASFIPWSAGLNEHLLSRFPLENGVSPIAADILLEPKWLLCLVRDSTVNEVADHQSGSSIEDGQPQIDGRVKNEIQATHMQLTDLKRKSDSDYFTVELLENIRVTPNTHWQDVRHLVFAANVPVRYGPGDVLTIYPQNSADAVDELISLMGWTEVANELVKFIPSQRKPDMEHYPPPPVAVYGKARMTLRYLLTNHLDISAVPRRSFFAQIARFTVDPFHKDRLLDFTDPKYVDELYDYTTRPRRSVLEVLQEFESVKIPWQWAASVLPKLRGRQFSIASGGHLKTNTDGTARFELLVAIVKYKTVIRKVREGVCTKYLAGLKSGDHLEVSLQRGGLGVSKFDLRAPVIMIAPGTGIAPMRSLIWERNLWRKGHTASNLTDSDRTLNGDPSTGKSLLFFGCRNESADYFFKEEWKDFEKMGTLHVFPAFSRDQARKYYVQDAIRDNSGAIFTMLHSQGAIVYVCGSSGKMPTAVRGALADVIRENGFLSEDQSADASPMDEAAAWKYLEALERAGRYKQETW